MSKQQELNLEYRVYLDNEHKKYKIPSETQRKRSTTNESESPAPNEMSSMIDKDIKAEGIKKEEALGDIPVEKYTTRMSRTDGFTPINAEPSSLSNAEPSSVDNAPEWEGSGEETDVPKMNPFDSFKGTFTESIGDDLDQLSAIERILSDTIKDL